MLTVADAMARALAYHRGGDLGAAARIYQQVIATVPTEPDAYHLLGLAHQQKQDLSKAIELIRKAIELSPENAVYYGSLGVALKQSGSFDEAIWAYRTSLQLAPDVPETLFNLGKSLKHCGRVAEAESAFRRSVQLQPQGNAAWLSWMKLYAEKDELQRAIEVGELALRSAEAGQDVCFNLGLLYRRDRRWKPAANMFQRVLDANPGHIPAQCKLASTLVDMREVETARRVLNQAFAVAPLDTEVLSSLGAFFNAMGDFPSSVFWYRQAYELASEEASIQVGLTSALRKAGQLTESLELMQRSLGDPLERHRVICNSQDSPAWINRALVHMALGQVEQAQSCFRLVLELQPGHTDAMSGLLLCMQYVPGLSAQELKREHHRWNDVHGQSSSCRLRVAPPTSGRKIRLGFVSADLGCHPVGYFTVQMFEHLDRETFETFVFCDRLAIDSMTERIRESVSAWHDTREHGDRALGDLIRGLNIDLLFDLSGHTAGNRLRVFASRAAPVQISWAGYVGTTGLTEMDYLLADPLHVALGEDGDHCEHILRMPGAYVCFDPPQHAPPVSELPALQQGCVTLAAMANPAKVNSQLLNTWGRILAEIPKAKLLLCYRGWKDEQNQDRVRKSLSVYGVERQVEFDQCSNRDEVLQKYQQVDLALDTFPYSGGLTTCEAMWMGVPTVTLSGDRFAGRHSTSHLTNAGLVSYVTTTEEQYVKRAIEAATNLQELSSLRRGLRARLATSPLCDGPGFAADFAKLMKQVHARHCI